MILEAVFVVLIEPWDDGSPLDSLTAPCERSWAISIWQGCLGWVPDSQTLWGVMCACSLSCWVWGVICYAAIDTSPPVTNCMPAFALDILSPLLWLSYPYLLAICSFFLSFIPSFFYFFSFLPFFLLSFHHLYLLSNAALQLYFNLVFQNMNHNLNNRTNPRHFSSENLMASSWSEASSKWIVYPVLVLLSLEGLFGWFLLIVCRCTLAQY